MTSWVDDSNAALLTDFYELTMAASYHRRGMNQPATFDLFVRKIPEKRNFLVACGLEQALHYLENLRFDQASLDYLDSLGAFDQEFLSYLADLRFSGDVWAIREGDLVFGGEPLLQVRAPLIEAQIVETFLLNCLTFQTMVATKAARVAIACAGKTFVDFSPRRDHAADAALKGARAAFVGGAAATSNVLAGREFGIPLSGTMAHSYVMAFEDETEAFRSFCRDFPDRAVLLIDTFDVEEGARRAAAVARELEPEGVRLRGVRIDSGDLGPLTRSVRKILDEAGLESVQIFLSGDMNEYKIKDLLDDDVPVDAFGVGTELGTSADAPTLGGVYKLVAEEDEPKMKLSAGKVTLPGAKQVYRFQEDDGTFCYDLIALDSERVEGGTPLLSAVMCDGTRLHDHESLQDIKSRCAEVVGNLPEHLRSLERPEVGYEIKISDGLQRLVAEIERTHNEVPHGT